MNRKIFPVGSVTYFKNLWDGCYFSFVNTNLDFESEYISYEYFKENNIPIEINNKVYRKEDFCLAINMKDILAFRVPIHPDMKVIKVKKQEFYF